MSLKGYLLLALFGIGFGYCINAQSDDSLRISPIPLSDIAATAAKDLKSTRDLLLHQIQANDTDVKPQIDSLHLQVLDLRKISDPILDNSSKLSYYNSLKQRWEIINSKIKPIDSDLKKYSIKMEDIRDTLSTWQLKWEITLQESDPAPPEDLMVRIISIRSYIDSTTQILSDSLNSSISLQSQITDLQVITDSYLQTIQELQLVELGEALLTKDSPIFSLKTEGDSVQTEEDKTSLLIMGMKDTKVYLGNSWSTMLLLIVSFFGLLAGFIYLRRVYVPAEPEEDPDEKFRTIVISKPGVTALIFTMLLAVWWLPDRPLFLREIFSMLLIIPFLPLFYAIVFKVIRLSLFYLLAIYIFSILNEYLQLGLVYERFSSLLESIALFSFHVYFLLARKKLRNDSVKGSLHYNFLKTVQPFFFLLTLSAILANLIGYRNYAELINEAVLSSLIILMVLGTGFFSLISIISAFFQTKFADRSRIIEKNKERIYRKITRYLRLGTFYLWGFFTLRFFYLWEPLAEGVGKGLEFGYDFGSVHITVSAVLSFVLIVYLSWLVSYIIRNLLELEIFSRFDMPRGVSKAVSSLTQYFLISLGFIMALSAAGFSVQNLSLLAGALGVGIGFGLQNIILNFISGLILAFERPVTVGDIINVSGNEGEVQKIGIRASVIKQYDGSEVIVPNAELISSKVINWTLSKYTRRSILTIHTHKDTDTDVVLQILKDAVSHVDFVLKEPEAKSYFHGIKDNELEFALYYWASGNLLDCRSLVNQEVQKALVRENIEFVMPLHVVMQNEK